jgi:hypothetical protein
MPTLADLQALAAASLIPGQTPIPGTMTPVFAGSLVSTWVRFDWTNAMVVALGAVTAGDIAVCTLPPNVVVENALVIIRSAETSANALTVAVGKTAAAYVDYLTAQDAKAAANTIYGKLAAERGTSLVGSDIPSLTANTLINAHFIKTTTNLNTCTLSAGSVYLKLLNLP